MDMSDNPKNYFQMMNLMQNKGVDPKVIGYYSARGVLNNLMNNLHSYLSSYPKHFMQKEEEALFSSLERMISAGAQQINAEDETALLAGIQNTYDKIGSRLVRINFVYDALNIISEREDIGGACLFLGDQLVALKKPLWKADENMPDYKLNDPNQRLNEYYHLIQKLRKGANLKYGVPIQ